MEPHHPIFVDIVTQHIDTMMKDVDWCSHMIENSYDYKSWAINRAEIIDILLYNNNSTEVSKGLDEYALRKYMPGCKVVSANGLKRSSIAYAWRVFVDEFRSRIIGDTELECIATI
jgi:hypothetical protein